MSDIRKWMNIFEDSKDFRVFVNDDGELQIEFHNKNSMRELVVYSTNTDSFILRGTILSPYIYYDGDYSEYYTNVDFIFSDNGNIKISHDATSSIVDDIAYEIATEIADNFYDEYAPDQDEDPDGYDEYVNTLSREVKDNIEIDEETAKRDVKEILDYVKANIGTTYDEIYSHVAAPPDSLLGIE